MINKIVDVFVNPLKIDFQHEEFLFESTAKLETHPILMHPASGKDSSLSRNYFY